MSTRLIIKGVAYTPNYDNDNFDQVFLTRNEMTNEFAISTIGLPVYIEHDTDGPRVGHIINAYIDELWRLRVVLALDVKFFNEMIYDKIKNGYFRDMSLGHNVHLLTDPSTSMRKIVAKRPTEVSIVRVGDRPGTHIDYCEFEL